MIKGKYAAEVMAYANGVVSGEIIAGEDRINGCKRFLSDIESGKWDIRTKDADFVIGIIQNVFRHRQGETLTAEPIRGTPFLLEPWEKFCVYGMLIFFIPGTNERRIKETFIYIPRKNGKTIFTSALSWALGLLQRLSGSKVYVVGAALKQAMETFDNWSYNIEQVQYGSFCTHIAPAHMARHLARRCLERQGKQSAIAPGSLAKVRPTTRQAPKR